MNFNEALMNESRKTFTENGATAYNTSGDKVLDFFSSVGSLRMADPIRIERLFADAYYEDPLLATKALFYARDIREGLGERRTFRTIINYAAIKHPEAILPNIPFIGFYGRFDDLYSLIGTPVEEDMWRFVSEQLAEDTANMKANKACSLLAKWLKTADASSPKTRELGIYTAKKLGMSVYDYKRKLRALRKYLKVVEVKMSANEWDQIDYSVVPSRAMMNYRNAFKRHDPDGYQEYLSKVEKGEEKINASTLYPYDILEKYDWFDYGWGAPNRINEDPVLEVQWKALPNYVEPGTNVLVIADTSGSMHGRPINSAVGLAIYFAEKNTGAYHNLWMSFSCDSKVQMLHGETLAQKLHSIDTEHWGGNTNLERAFMNILEIARMNFVSPDEMVKTLIVISDMEIDCCTGSWSFYDEMRQRFRSYGYEIPSVVFWNVNSRHDIFHADKDRKGVVLCSGQAASTFKNVINTIGKTPVDVMLDVLNSERYDLVTIG